MAIPSPTCKSCIYWKDAQKEDGYVNCVGGRGGGRGASQAAQWVKNTPAM